MSSRLIILVLLSMPFFLGGVHSLDAPWLKGIYYINESTYGLYWGYVSNTTFYVLQEDDSSGFDSPSTLYSGEERTANVSAKSQGTYHYRVRACGDQDCGNWSSRLIIAYSEPFISEIKTEPLLGGEVVEISWMTDGLATFQVEYGKTADYGTITEEPSQTSSAQEYILMKYLNTSHHVTLANLDYNTTYHFRVLSRNAEGETAVSGDMNFTTPVIDIDGDGVINIYDLCPDTLSSEAVDMNGCSEGQRDNDGDGVPNAYDLCSDTMDFTGLDEKGCSEGQRDDDGDTIPNAEDQCPNTPKDGHLDISGCSEGQRDGDGDGVPDEKDYCVDSNLDDFVDAQGCSENQIDADGDGVIAKEDLCPNDKGLEDNYGCPNEIIGIGLPCSPGYSPVCGADGKSYVNPCVARGVGLEVAYHGRCRDTRPEDCPDDINYVCGTDGRTYKNPCLAEAFGSKVRFSGRCEDVFICPDSDEDMILGTACGFDGITFWGNSCDNIGREIAYYGGCINSLGLAPCPFNDDDCFIDFINAYRLIDYDMDGVPNERDLCPDTGAFMHSHSVYSTIGWSNEYGCDWYEEPYLSTKNLLWVIQNIWDPDDYETINLLLIAVDWWDPQPE